MAGASGGGTRAAVAVVDGNGEHDDRGPDIGIWTAVYGHFAAIMLVSCDGAGLAYDPAHVPAEHLPAVVAWARRLVVAGALVGYLRPGDVAALTL